MNFEKAKNFSHSHGNGVNYMAMAGDGAEDGPGGGAGDDHGYLEVWQTGDQLNF